MDCPNEECHSNVEGMRKTLFGPDGLSGVAACVKNAVPKKWLWIGFVVIGIPLLVTGIKVWFGQESAHLRYAPLSAQSVLSARMDVADERYAHICAALQRLEKMQAEMKEELKTIFPKPPSPWN